MPSCRLYFLQARPIIECGGNECGAHGMCRVSPLESNVPCVLPQRAVNDIGVQRPTCHKTFAIVAHRPEEWSLDIITMPRHPKIIADALRRLWVL
jgi:hypothetical protein